MRARPGVSRSEPCSSESGCGAYTVRVFNRHRSRDRDQDLPRHDEVVAELHATKAALEPQFEELEVVAFRPSMRASVVRVSLALVAVGAALLVPYIFGTTLGQQQLESRGVLGLLATWLMMVALVTIGALLGIAVARSISNPTRRVRRTQTLRLALGEAGFAAAGATFAAVIVMSIDFMQMVSVLGIVFVMAFLFSWAMLFPLYRSSWDTAAGSSAA